jgi:hypothetical protein
MRHESGVTGLPSACSSSGVSMEPGEMALTRMLERAASLAADLVRPMTPCLLAT